MRRWRILTPGRALVDGRLRADLSVLVDTQLGCILALGPLEGLREISSQRALREGVSEHAVEQIDLPGRVLLPGAVNAHSHAFQVLLRGRADNAPTFGHWVRDHMYPLVEGLSREDLLTASFAAFCEMALSGVTTVGEFYYLHNGPDGERLGAELDRAVVSEGRRVGLRVALCRALYDDESVPARRRFAETVDEAVAATRALGASLADDPLATVLPAPHSLHGASAAMIEAGHALARELDTPCHIHLAEQEGDLAFSRERYGETPLRALERLGVADERLVCIHGVFLDEGEWRLLGERRGGLVYNPSANLFLGDGITALETAVRAGVTVALGCDGPGGSNRLDPFEEMRLAELLQRGTQRRMGVLSGALPGDPCPPFAMATRNGGRVLGLKVGEIHEGYGADLVAVDPDDVSIAPARGLDEDPALLLDNLVYAGVARAFVTDVFVGGRDVVRGRALRPDLAAELSERWPRLASRQGEAGTG